MKYASIACPWSRNLRTQRNQITRLAANILTKLKKKKKFCTLMHFEYICLYVQIAGRKVSKLSTLDIEMCIKHVYKHASQQLLR